MNELMSNGQWLIIRYSESGWQTIKRICSLLNFNKYLDANFQLWIIIEETEAFPLDVLRMSFKGKFYHIYFVSLSSIPAHPMPIWILYNSCQWKANQSERTYEKNIRRTEFTAVTRFTPNIKFFVVRSRLFPCCHSSRLNWIDFRLQLAAFVLIFYGICFQKERLKYGKIGWNINYEFNDFDFDLSFNVLNTLVANDNSICWISVKYFLGEVI